jgi:peptidoglycan/xylan/chitin deacetylase (PgdA/CDA1 family)
VAEQLPDRLARRRRELRKREMRRRRVLLGCAGAFVAILVVFLLTRESGDEGRPAGPGGGERTAANNPDKAPEAKKPQVAGARPDSTWKPSKAPVPILMYHVIGDPAGEVAYPDLYLSVDDFEEQVEWLDRNGYTAVTLVQVQDAWYDGGTLPGKPVVLSFDDGYLGQYLDAMPILAKHGWAGQLNLKAEGSDLSSKQVKKMIRAGWEIASHTITHPDLPSIPPEQLRTELVDSKKMLERDLGIEIENFCYPAGQYDGNVVAAVEAAGYRGATTVDPGLADRSEPFTLKRIRIDNGFGASELAAALDV